MSRRAPAYPLATRRAVLQSPMLGELWVLRWGMFRSRRDADEDQSRYEIKESARVFEARTSERFSRIEFALRVLDLLRPNINVTLYESLTRIHVRRGRDWSVGPNASWALVAIPRSADRHSIAYALAELTGRADDAFVVDLVARAHRLNRAS